MMGGNVTRQEYTRVSRAIRRHYGLNRKVTDVEVDAEVESIMRKGTAFCCDLQSILAARIEVALGRGSIFPTGL